MKTRTFKVDGMICNQCLANVKKTLRLWLTVVFTAIFGMANASNAQWYGYALYTSDGASWQNHFVSFNTQNPDAVQTVSETLPTIWAATYLDGYVWFVTQTRSLCKAPFDETTQTIGAYTNWGPLMNEGINYDLTCLFMTYGYESTDEINVGSLAQGIYTVRTDNRTVKFVKE